jgi:hypothetical protein
MRLHRDGKPDKSFGYDGLLRIPFPTQPHRFTTWKGSTCGVARRRSAPPIAARTANIVALIDLASGRRAGSVRRQAG